VLWIISHSDLVTDDELAGYDVVLVASEPLAEQLRSRTRAPVEVMHQATDAIRFRPRYDGAWPAPAPVVVVANGRESPRPGPRWLMESGVDFALYGSYWRPHPERRFVVAEHVPNEHIAELYSTASIVVADQHDQMSRAGFVANRLFDVAAAGGFAISTAAPGVHDVFGDLVPTFSDRDSLAEAVHRYLVDGAERRRRSTAAMLLVRGRHTFDNRVADLVRLLGV
jgi:hypothetical protein